MSRAILEQYLGMFALCLAKISTSDRRRKPISTILSVRRGLDSIHLEGAWEGLVGDLYQAKRPVYLPAHSLKSVIPSRVASVLASPAIELVWFWQAHVDELVPQHDSFSSGLQQLSFASVLQQEGASCSSLTASVPQQDGLASAAVQ